ncbi:MAG: Gfo/Idh/MocA family oxidoreductase [Bacteroidetes bacterium]|nr:Gfo/Idh/MocA family oxidoreductase [Bacteroidota bacterium]
MKRNLNRRDFIRTVAVAGAGFAIGDDILAAENYGSPSFLYQPIPTAAPLNKVRIGFVGVGGMGMAHVENLLKIDGAQIVAVCDIVESRVKEAQDMVEKAGFNRPEGYSKNEFDWQRLCAANDIDLIYTATPWQWHVPICLAAMNNGKHAATEVPAAISLDECWELVETSEKTGKYCVMMENCNYDKVEMMILNMVKKGLFGEMVHAECGYLHDLRAVKHDMNGEGLWRRDFSMTNNGDLYPTHGLGPVMQCMDINRGNYFDCIVSFGSKTRGLHEYAVSKFGADSSQAQEKYTLSDVVTTLIKTMNGETIVVTHDTSLPRPYSRDILVQGTHGIVRKYPDPKIYIEGISKTNDKWEPLNDYLLKYQHPVWTELEDASKGAGHGGMDFIEDFRLINALLKGIEPDMDVYDAAAMSAVRMLSERSIAKQGKTLKFPDFTRGMWKKPRMLQVMNRT